MVISLVFQTLGYIITKFVYQMNASISAFEVMAARAPVQVLFNIFVLKLVQ